MRKREMHLGVFVLGTGNHIAGWRMEGAYDSFQSLSVIQNIARIAERGCFDLFFLGDTLSAGPNDHPSFTARFEPLTMLGALAATTSHIGLGATASTSFNEPFNVARQFASLDHLSSGRAAWNAVTSSNPRAAPNFGRDLPEHDERYHVAEEFVDVVMSLWDCWDEGAIIADRATGQYIDPTKMKPLNHIGKYFQVRGPLNIGRCPQGRPIVLQAGASEAGLDLAARTADVVFSVVQDFAEAKDAYRSLKERMSRFGRHPDEIAILPGVMPILGRTRQEAWATLDKLQSFVTNTNAASLLSARLGLDVSGFPLDEKVPDLPLPNTSHGFARAMLSKAKREGMTWRDLHNLTGAARGHWVIAGTKEDIADTLQAWFEGGAADGFNILPAWFPGAFDGFVDEVVPELQRRGLYRKHYTATTLRGHLGLGMPKNRLF